MSSTSEIAVGKKREVTLGTNPAGTFAAVRRTGGEGTYTTDSQASDVVRADSQAEDPLRIDISAGFVIEDEWAYGAHDEEIEDCLGSLISTALAVDGSSGDISAVAAGNSIDSTTTDAFNSIEPGQVIRCFGFPTNDDGGPGTDAFTCRVVSRTTGANPVMVVAGITLVNETPSGSDAKIRGEYTRNSTTIHGSTVEVDFGSALATKRFKIFRGLVCSGMVFQFDHPGKMTVTFTYEGFTSDKRTDATATGGPYTAVTQVASMTSLHFAAGIEGGTAMTGIRVKGFTLNCNRPKRKIGAAGTLGAVDFGGNTWDVTATLNVYNNAAAALIEDKHQDFTVSNLEFRTDDADGNSMHLWLPRLYYDSGIAGQGAKDSDSMIPLGFRVARDPTDDFMVQWSKLPTAS